MRTAYRVAVICLLFGALFGLAVHYDGAREANWPHPDAEALVESPDTYDDEAILLIGEVEAVNPDENEIVYRPDEDVDLSLTATDVEESVEVGGVVHVYGEVDMTAETQTAASVVVVNHDPSDQRYKLVLSGFGVIFAAGLFLRYWHIDWRTLSFRRRHG